MSRRKGDLVDDLSKATASTVEELRNALAISLSGEAMRLMSLHRDFYHTTDKKDCKICRSFRRTILGGLSK